MQLLQRIPLSRKILLGIVPLFLLFITVSVGLQTRYQEREMMEQAQASASTYAEILRASLVSMMVNDLEVDSTFLDRVSKIEQLDTVHILLNNLRLRQELMTAQRRERVEFKYRASRATDDVERQVLLTGSPEFLKEGNHFRAVIPFNATSVCQKCHAVPVGYTLGATDLHISFDRIARASDGNRQRSLVIFLIFTIVVMTVAMVMFTRFVSKPVDRLVIATNEISKGNLDHVMFMGAAGEVARDELDVLAARFDEMRLSLKEKIDQLDQVNHSLSRRNSEVEEALWQLRRTQEDLVRSERLAVTGRLTAQLSHEINNPIHNIQSLLQSSLRKVQDNAQATELVSVALDEVSRMAKLTRQMLDVYRESIVEMEKEPVEISELLAEVTRMNCETLARQHINLSFTPSAERLDVLGSRDKLKQVLLNLINNARDAQPEGGSIALIAEEHGGNALLMVRDEGTGIAPEYIDRIFDAFFTTKKEVSGVGLGLAVTYGIVLQHKGTIEVQSDLGRGTTFTIHLPLSGNNHGS